MGVSTITAVDYERLNTGNFVTNIRRPLVLEVWYPAQLTASSGAGISKATYRNVTRLQQPFELQGEAYRDVTAVSEGQFPLIFLSHGFTGYRTQMFYLGEPVSYTHLRAHET